MKASVFKIRAVEDTLLLFKYNVVHYEIRPQTTICTSPLIIAAILAIALFSTTYSTLL